VTALAEAAAGRESARHGGVLWLHPPADLWIGHDGCRYMM
jgi:hypothetical protein